MKQIHTFLFFFVLFSFFSGCNKPDVYQAPSIEILSPHFAEQFSTPGLMFVECKISSSYPIKFVSASVVNSDQVSLFGREFYYPESITSVITFDFELGILPEGEKGPYFLNVAVDDGIELSHAYLQINLSNSPLLFKGFYTVSRPSVNKTKIVFFDNQFVASDSIELPGEFVDVTVSGNNEMFFIATSIPAKLYAFEHFEMDQKWVQEPELPYPEYTSLNHDYSQVLVGTANERIACLADITGIQMTGTPILVDSVPRKIGVNSDFIIGDFVNRKPGDGAWVSFYRGTGVPHNRLSSAMRVVDFYNSEAVEKFHVFCNKGARGAYILFDVVSNSILFVDYIGQGNISHSALVNQNEAIISIENQVYRYTISSSFSSGLLQLENEIVDLAYNSVSQQILVATSDNVLIYSYPGGGLIKKIPSPSPVKAIFLWQGY